MSSYNPADFEKKWQDHWISKKIFKADDSDRSKPKYYILDMFPYPSGAGLHVGHPEGYTATDILARYKRMRGFNVLHPIGWDAFGLPAEQYAIKTGTHPAITTEKNINKFRQQLQAIGFSYDWDSEVNTTDPNYYKWTQWIFLQLFNKGLAYESYAPVNWCPELGTVLANEEVIDGKSEVGGFPVIRKPMRQWMLKITAYAERLLSDLDELDWPESIKEMQRNWIGKSTGAEIVFNIDGYPNYTIDVFTTRPDTLFGATYMVLSPEHELVQKITSPKQLDEISNYIEAASKKSDLDRSELNKNKTGVFTGAYAINPVTSKNIPIYVADYVLMSYGSGAIMAVPGHDERDWEFAKKYNLPIIEVVAGGNVNAAAFTDNENGVLVNSANESIDLNDLKVPEAKEKIIKWLDENQIGKSQVNYRLRDWLFSRQRYWGEPFPIIHVEGQAKAVEESDLPVRLPQVDSFKPTGTGEPPLAQATDWVHTLDPETDKPAIRETNTMPQWAGSCWYYLRYIDPDYTQGPVNPDKEKYWMPVDLYVGGAEHAVLHLLYARFWHKVLFDCGVVSTKEPFYRLVNQGMILGEMEFTAYKDENGNYLNPNEINSELPYTTEKLKEDALEKKGNGFVIKGTTITVEAKSHKMSKSRGNVINPDDIIAVYGADSLRLYEMFMGPLEQVKPWSMKGVEGVYRFLKRVYRLIVDEEIGNLSSKINDSKSDTQQLKALHEAIKKVTGDIEDMKFNTAISALMIFVNEAYRWETIPKEILKPFIQILNPFAPHLAEEMWSIAGYATDELSYTQWPEFNESYLIDDSFTYAIQVNGKVRAEITIPMNMSTDKDYVLGKAKDQVPIKKFMTSGTLRKEIFVPKRIVNLVIN